MLLMSISIHTLILKNWINQQYLPNEVKEISFYKPGSEGREGLLNKRLDAIKNQE